MKRYVKKPGNSKKGRKPIKINYEDFEKLCKLQATLCEIAGWFNCSEDTIERRVEDQYNCKFADVYKSLSAAGRISLRRAQFKLAQTNASMAIWLGKQHLGQRDNHIMDFQFSQKQIPPILFTDNSEYANNEIIDIDSNADTDTDTE